jgi:hypothetical protein
MVFDNSQPKTYLQVLFRGTHCLRFWANYSEVTGKDGIIHACGKLESACLLCFPRMTFRLGLNL